MDSLEEKLKLGSFISSGNTDIPDLIIIEKEAIQGKVNEKNWKKALTRKERPNLRQHLPLYIKELKHRIVINGHRYVLDSAVLRDNSHTHFSAYLSCGKKEKWFDGAGLEKPINFKWKHLITENVDIDDRNYASSTWENMFWNFIKGYVAFFYYREK